MKTVSTYPLIKFSGESEKQSFTLIEALIVTAIMAVVASAIGACLAGGLKAWDSTRDFMEVETDALMDLERFRSDLVNSTHFHDIEFTGEKTSVSFPLLTVPGSGNDRDPEIRRTGTVKYFFDDGNKALYRKQWFYPDPEPGDARPGDLLVSRLEDVTMEYFRKPGEETDGAWLQSWENATNFPGRVKLTLDFLPGTRPGRIVRTVVLPCVQAPETCKQ